MNNFLKENGLQDAIPIFTYHELEINILKELTDDNIEELLPAIGDRLKFKAGLQRIREQKKAKSCRRRQETEMTFDESNRIERIGNVAAKEEVAVQALKSHKKLTEKLRYSAIEMITDYVPLSLHLKYPKVLNGWDVINFENGSLNCPFCTRDIALRYRTNTEKFTWNICSFQGHLNYAHGNVTKLKLRADFFEICTLPSI